MNQPASLISVVIPVCNEEDNVLPLAREIQAALRGRHPFEILFVAWTRSPTRRGGTRP